MIFLTLIFRGLDAFGDLYFLFACQQRHLPHLLEIHAHRIVQCIQMRRFLLVNGPQA